MFPQGYQAITVPTDGKTPSAAKQHRQRMLRAGAITWYKLGKTCLDCGIGDYRVLEFDHVTGEKKYNIKQMISLSRPLSEILAEIEKCDLVCRNCHLVRTISRETGLTRYKVFGLEGILEIQ